MKPEKINLVKIGYNKEKNKYFATFNVLGLDKNEIEKVIKYIQISGNKRDCKPYINDNDFYITDFFEAELFESMYSHMIDSAEKGMIPERVEHEILDKEIDICLMEQDIEFAVRNAANLRKYKAILKSVVDD